MKIYSILISFLLLSCSTSDKKSLVDLNQKYTPTVYKPVDYRFQIDWEDYGPDLINKAVLEKKPIILFVYKNNCEDCYNMFVKTFMDIDVIKLINNNFLITKLNASLYPEEAKQYIENYNIPMTIIMHPEGYAVFGITNFIEPGKFYNIFSKLGFNGQELIVVES